MNILYLLHIEMVTSGHVWLKLAVKMNLTCSFLFSKGGPWDSTYVTHVLSTG